MTEEQKELKPVENAPLDTNGVKEEAPAAPADDKIVELVETIDALTKNYEKLKSDSENYKQGMIDSKRKLKDLGIDDEEPVNNDQLSSVVSKLLDEKLSPILERLNPKDDIVSRANRQVSELKTALLNRTQILNSNTASTGEDAKPKDNYFSPEQIAELKKRGVDVDKARENMIRLRDKQKL